MDLALAFGIGIGLASAAGVRAFLPLLLVALSYAFAPNPPNMLLPPPSNAVLIWALLLALALLECVLDEFVAFGRLLNWVMVPVRAAAGAILLAGVWIEDGPTVYVPTRMGSFYLWTLSEAPP